jgi:tetratricopeptide (TPR) repeat protein
MKRLEIFDRTRSTPPHEWTRKADRYDDASLMSLAGRLEGRVVKEGQLSLIEVEHTIGKDQMHGDVRLGDIEGVEKTLLAVLFPTVSDPDGLLDQKRFLFFDIETTGLSTGAGTRFFLIGMLKVAPGEIKLLQYFLTNLRSEPLFLNRVKQQLGCDDVLVSYNGKSFDYNVIRNRYILNGLDMEEKERVHLDLLYPSRRLWKGFYPDFTLGTIERAALGFRRGIDIPGERIPDVYSGYLREGHAGDDLYTIFIHNKNDILSLLALLLRQVETVHEGMKPGGGSLAFNHISLSDMLFRSGFVEEARRVLFSRPDDAEAAKRLGLLYKRERSYSNALDHFSRAVRKVKGVGDYVFLCTEIAKIHEHALKDYKAALSIAVKAQERLLRGGVFYPDRRGVARSDISTLERRIRRLEKKIAKNNR